jgi:hypothetical protein
MPEEKKSAPHGVAGKNAAASEGVKTRRKIRGRHGKGGYWNHAHTHQRNEAVRIGKKKRDPKATRKKEGRRLRREEAEEKNRHGYPLTRAEKKLLRIIRHQDPTPIEEEGATAP